MKIFLIYSIHYSSHYLYILYMLSVVTQDGVFILDMAAKIDATADYICKAKWGDVEFPPPFGREAYPEVRGLLGYASNTSLGVH